MKQCTPLPEERGLASVCTSGCEGQDGVKGAHLDSGTGMCGFSHLEGCEHARLRWECEHPEGTGEQLEKETYFMCTFSAPEKHIWAGWRCMCTGGNIWKAQVTAGSIPGVTPECTWMLTCTSGSHQRRSGCANMIWAIAHLGTHLEISRQRVPPNPGLRWPHIWPSAHIWNAQLHLHPWGCPDSTQCAGSHPMCRIPALPATPNLHSGGLGCDALFIHPSLSSPGMAKVNKY